MQPPHPARLAAGKPDLSGQVGALGEQTHAAKERLAAATDRLAALSADERITSRPDSAAFLTAEHTAWSWRDQAFPQQAAARAGKPPGSKPNRTRAWHVPATMRSTSSPAGATDPDSAAEHRSSAEFGAPDLRPLPQRRQVGWVQPECPSAPD